MACTLSRRDALKLASVGALTPSVSGFFPQLAAHAAQQDKKPKACILLWMSGGPSQVHTFNIPTEGQFQQYKGMKTAVPGIHISEYLPKLAASMKDLALIQTMSTGVNVHGPAHYLMHIGHRQGAFNYPSLGAIVAMERHQPDLGIPNYLCLGAGQVPSKYVGSGPLGPDFTPLMVNGNGIDNLISDQPNRDAIRAALLEKVEQTAAARFQDEAILAHQASYRKAFELMHSDKSKVFDVKSEPANIQSLYGPSGFGQSCLLARRLVETGVKFVEVTWGGHGGGAEPVMKKSPELDQGFSGLLADLKTRGLLDSTLVVWMGEFGRGPRPGAGGGNNNGIGAGHYAACWTTVLAGAGLKTGQIIGQSTKDAAEVKERPVSAGDFMATLCKALDIDHQKTYDVGGRPLPYTAFGSKPVDELF
jgi:uncharacterized protein (DUF1501 family)